jgi:hypothetical protein
MQIDSQNGLPRASTTFKSINPSDFTLQLEHLKLNSGIPYMAEFHVDPYLSSFSLDYSEHASTIRTYAPADLQDPASIGNLILLSEQGSIPVWQTLVRLPATINFI